MGVSISSSVLIERRTTWVFRWWVELDGWVGGWELDGWVDRRVGWS